MSINRRPDNTGVCWDVMLWCPDKGKPDGVLSPIGLFEVLLLLHTCFSSEHLYDPGSISNPAYVQQTLPPVSYFQLDKKTEHGI